MRPRPQPTPEALLVSQQRCACFPVLVFATKARQHQKLNNTFSTSSRPDVETQKSRYSPLATFPLEENIKDRKTITPLPVRNQSTLRYAYTLGLCTALTNASRRLFMARVILARFPLMLSNSCVRVWRALLPPPLPSVPACRPTRLWLLLVHARTVHDVINGSSRCRREIGSVHTRVMYRYVTWIDAEAHATC